MKKIVLVAALTIALPVFAQAPKAPAKEPAAKPASTGKKSSKRQEDARHCLEQTSNTAIIKCAEAYL